MFDNHMLTGPCFARLPEPESMSLNARLIVNER